MSILAKLKLQFARSVQGQKKAAITRPCVQLSTSAHGNLLSMRFTDSLEKRFSVDLVATTLSVKVRIDARREALRLPLSSPNASKAPEDESSPSSVESVGPPVPHLREIIHV